MTPNRPYLIRALHEWITDNGLTAHIAVNALYPGTYVPSDLVEDGQLILNISPQAVSAFNAGNEAITFSARFSGVARDVRVPVEAVLALFARENGQGMAFEPVEPEPPEPEPGPSGGGGRKSRGHLKLVK